MKESKLVIVMRKDLKVRKGKLMAQSGHAALDAFLSYMGYTENRRGRDYILHVGRNSALYNWLETGKTKICVGIPDEVALHVIYQRARAAELPCALIKDAGRTEFKEPTFTACGIGPWWSDEIDLITGDLKLL